MARNFSDRHGYQAPDRDISVREDAPEEFRDAVGQLAIQSGMSYGTLREVVCAALLARPDPNNWSEIPNIRDEVFWHLENCDWFKVYDIAEAIYAHLSHSQNSDPSRTFSDRLNQLFRERGIGWQMEEGNVQYRGTESFTQAVKEGQRALSNTGRSQAANELAEAVRDISRRPQPDVTGAVQHAMAALEATARDVTGQPKPTLGKLVSSLDLKPPLDAALEKLWGYVSNEARHGRQDSALDAVEAEVIVGVAGAVCGFLAKANGPSTIDRDRKMHRTL